MMTVKQIQEEANLMCTRYRGNMDYTVRLAELIADLAARILEQTEGVAQPKNILRRKSNAEILAILRAISGRVIPEPVDKLKKHYVTVEYRVTKDVNDEIMDAIIKHGGNNLDYVQIVAK